MHTSKHSQVTLTCFQIMHDRKHRFYDTHVCAGLYFAAGVFLDLFLLGATTFAGVNYSTNAEAFQKAVRQVAGQSSGINVVDKAQSAVNTVKIINALNEISDILKVCPPTSYMHFAERTAYMCRVACHFRMTL